MKQTKLFLSLLMLLVFSIGNVWGASPYSTNLKGTYEKNGGTISLNNVTWTYGSANYLSAPSNAVQIGSKNNPQTNGWTITTDISNIGTNIVVTKVTINARTNGTGSYSIKVGSASATSGNLTTTDADYSATSLTETSGKIEITITGKTKAAYLNSISITYTSNSTEAALSSISVSGTPTKTEYIIGEAFDPTGLIVTGTYSDNSTKTITDGIDWTCDPETFMEASDNATVNVTAKVGDVSGFNTITGIKVSAPYTYNYDFSKIDDFADWESSYIQHDVNYTEAKVQFTKANRQTSGSITNMPVTKGDSVIVSLTDANKCFAGIKFVCKQWGSNKPQTITFNYSTDGGTTFNKLTPSVTSDNFTLTVDADIMPKNVDAIKFTFSKKSNQVGIASVHFNTADKYYQEYDITVNAIPAEGGLVEADATKATEKKTITLTHVTNEGYRFAKWDVTAGELAIPTTKVDGKDEYIFVMPAANVTATANFTKTYELAISSQENGTINIAEGTYAEGDKIAVSLTPNAGYESGTLSIMNTEGQDVTVTYYDAESGQITMPAFDIWVSATFTAKSCTPLSSPDIKTNEEGTTYNAIKVTWNAVENAGRYVVSLKDENETEIVAPTETTDLFYVFSALKVNTGYYCYVKALPTDETTYCESEEASAVVSTTDYPTATLTLSENGNEVPFEGTYKLNDEVTLPTSIDNLCVGKQLVGWSEVEIETASATEPTSQYYKAGATYTIKEEKQTLYAVYAIIEKMEGSTTIIKYTKQSTSNLTTDNAATIFGLDASLWTIIADKGANSTNVGVNRDGTIRLYYNKDGSNTLSITAPKTISTIQISFVPNKDNAYIEVNGNKIAPENGKYVINATSFRIGNANTSNVQVQINQIDINFAGAITTTNYSTTCIAAIAAPRFDEEDGKIFDAENMVTITAVDGAKIYYNINSEDDPTTGSIEYDENEGIELTENGEYIIKAIAVKGEAQSEVVTATYGVLKPFASLDELIKCQYAEEKTVTVSFENITITKIFGKQVTLDSKKDEKNVIIYNSTEIPTDWNAKENGKLSATSIKCEWKKYVNKSNEFVGWELTPSDWTGFTYTDPVHITSIEISGDVAEKSYSAGQQLKSDGLIVTGIYSDHTDEKPHTETITDELTWTLPILTEGQTEAKVSVSYTEPILGNTITSEEYTITGLSVSAPRVLDHIEIATESTHKTEFFVGRPFTRDGLKVLAYYSISGVITGDPVDVTTACTYTTPNMQTEGEQAITITYTENEDPQTTTYDINLTYMNLTDLVTSTEVKDGDYVYVKFEDVMITNLYKSNKGYKGIYLSVQKDNKDIEIYSSTQIPNEWNVEVYGTVSGILNYVEWTYYSKGDVWELKPSNWDGITYKAPVVEELNISGTATTLTYTEGATFDPTGLKVEATIASTQQDVTDLVIWTFDPALLAEGTTSVTAKATYKEKEATTTIHIAVNPAPAFDSLDELIAATDVNSGDIVKVTLTNIKIENINQAHYVALESPKDAKEIAIYHSSIVPDAWVKGGTLSGTIYATWEFDNKDDRWYIVPTSEDWVWTELTYSDPVMEGDPVVIAFECKGEYYALGIDCKVYMFPKDAGVVADKMVNIPEADRANITWYRANVAGGVTFQNKKGEYLNVHKSGDTDIEVSTSPCTWSWNEIGYYTTGDARTLLYQKGANAIKNYAASNVNASTNNASYSSFAMYLSEYIDGEIADVRELNGNIGTLCLEKKVIAFEGAKFYRIHSKDAAVSALVKNVTFEEITETLEAGEACIFEPEDGATQIRVVYTGEAVVTPLAGNGLTGTFSTLNPLKGNTEGDFADIFFVINNKIHKAGDDAKLAPNRAYINMERVAYNAPRLTGRRYIVLGNGDSGTATGIDDMTDTNVIRGTYDVLGRKIGDTSAAGLYIVDGKKVLIVK